MHTKHYGAAIGHLIPSLLAIVLFEVLSIRIYSDHTENAALLFPIWICSQALGGLLFGYLSDRYCRRKAFIVTQFLGLICSVLVLWRGFDGSTIATLGFLFNPSPIARAALVDNFPRESKLPLISSTFVAQFLPWCFFIPIAHLSNQHAMISLLAFLFINLLLTVFYFQDRRDITRHHEKWNEGIKSSRSLKRVLLTLAALIPVEIVFFVSDTFIEKLNKSEPFFAALGLGTLIGTLMSFFYRKTPHISRTPAKSTKNLNYSTMLAA